MTLAKNYFGIGSLYRYLCPVSYTHLKNAEFAEKYLKKGLKILVSGRIQTGSYVNPVSYTHLDVYKRQD